MKKKIIVAVIVVISLFSIPCFAANKGAEVSAQESYRLGPGDVLDISVWGSEELTKQVIVLPDGSITFPLVGELPAEGKTVTQFKKGLAEKITEFVPDPDVSVSIMQVNSMMIYVIGKVNKPGHFPLNSRVTVLHALAMAGGLNTFANGEKIKIIRKIQAPQANLIVYFNYEEVTEDEKLEQNIMLERGDIVVVP